MKSQEEIKKQIANQLKAFESYLNKRKDFIGVKIEKKLTKHINAIKNILKV